MTKRRSASTVFVLGLWIGASIAVLGTVGYSFPGVERAMEENPLLAERAGFAPADVAAKKASALWVLVGELNRHYFRYFNRAQSVLAVLAALLAARFAGRGPFVLIVIAGALTLMLTLQFAPELTEQGRALDFVPRVPAPPDEARFLTLHRVYTALEATKLVCLAVAALLTARGVRCENP